MDVPALGMDRAVLVRKLTIGLFAGLTRFVGCIAQRLLAIGAIMPRWQKPQQ